MATGTAPVAIDFGALEFFESKLDRIRPGRTESPATAAQRARMAAGIALSQAKITEGVGAAIEFKLPKSGKLTEARSMRRKDKATGEVRTVQTAGGQDAVLNQTLRLLREEAEKAGRGLSVQVTEPNRATWLVKFQTKVARQTKPKPGTVTA